MVSCLKFRLLIHLEFTFVYGVKECSNFIDLDMVVRLSWLKRLSFRHCTFLPTLSLIK